MSSDTGKPLEETLEFQDAARRVPQFVRYHDKPAGDWGVKFPRGTRYSNSSIRYPGRGNRFHVVWVGPGDVGIQVDNMVKLYDVEDVILYEIDGIQGLDGRDTGPRSPGFALVDPKTVHGQDGLINFDANMFWTVALLFKHFRTCGIEKWDKELRSMSREHSQPRALMTAPCPPPMPMAINNNNNNSWKSYRFPPAAVFAGSAVSPSSTAGGANGDIKPLMSIPSPIPVLQSMPLPTSKYNRSLI